MIHLCGDSLVLPLRLLFNNMLRTSTFPSLWKLANVTPVFKKNDKQVVKNYRPISLLPLLSKIFEKILFNKVYEHLTKNNLIIPNQSGFRPMAASINSFILSLKFMKASKVPKVVKLEQFSWISPRHLTKCGTKA